MQIKTDKEGTVVIKQLCDVALKSGGLSNLGGITRVLACLNHPDRPKPQPVPLKQKAPVSENPVLVPVVPDKVNPKHPKRGKLKKK